jgi:hypothetical protein
VNRLLPAPFLPPIAAALVVSIVLGFGASAIAEPKDKAALDLDKAAIETDYLGTNFGQAEAKLKQALALCKGNACSGKVRARIHRDLGVVYIAGLKRVDDGKLQFVEAVKADPAITLDPDLTTPEIQAAFDEARKSAGGAAPPPAAPEEPAEPEPKPKAADEKPAAEGDLTHEPPDEQAVLTPVPIYAELPDDVKASKLTVRYKPFGSSAWKSASMSRHKDGWAGEIPCLDVGSATGNLEYFIQALNDGGDLVAFSGTRNAPHRVPIKNELDGDPPHLPGKPPPAQCQDTADCPPEFPGCKGDGDGGGEGEGEGDQGGPFAQNWVSLGLQQDIMLMPSTTGVCSGGNEFSCFYENPDEYYELTPVERGGNEIEGGPARATLRILVGYDRIVGANIGLGVRVGYAFGGGPQAPDGAAFLPIHAEGRLTYFFGQRPLANKGLRPFVHLSGGMAQVDAKVLVTVYDNDQNFAADKRTDLAAWRKTGLPFVALGGGLMFAVSPKSGPYLDLRFMQMLGESGTVIAPQLGYAIGF